VTIECNRSAGVRRAPARQVLWDRAVLAACYFASTARSLRGPGRGWDCRDCWPPSWAAT